MLLSEGMQFMIIPINRDSQRLYVMVCELVIHFYDGFDSWEWYDQ